MKLRRVRTPTGLETQQYVDGRWTPLRDQTPFGPSPFAEEWQIATADRHLERTDALLPFAPLSFRDFLLSERHNINASRGLVKRFYPRTHRLTELSQQVELRAERGE